MYLDVVDERKFSKKLAGVIDPEKKKNNRQAFYQSI